MRNLSTEKIAQTTYSKLSPEVIARARANRHALNLAAAERARQQGRLVVPRIAPQISVQLRDGSNVMTPPGLTYNQRNLWTELNARDSIRIDDPAGYKYTVAKTNPERWAHYNDRLDRINGRMARATGKHPGDMTIKDVYTNPRAWPHLLMAHAAANDINPALAFAGFFNPFTLGLKVVNNAEKALTTYEDTGRLGAALGQFAMDTGGTYLKNIGAKGLVKIPFRSIGKSVATGGTVAAGTLAREGVRGAATQAARAAGGAARSGISSAKGALTGAGLKTIAKSMAKATGIPAAYSFLDRYVEDEKILGYRQKLREEMRRQQQQPGTYRQGVPGNQQTYYNQSTPNSMTSTNYGENYLT